VLDNDLIKAFLPLINSGLIARGFADVVVRQSYQPTQQGADTGPAVYFFKVSDHRYGFPRRDSDWNIINSQMVHTETEIYETTFQISALITQDPSDTNSITASDLVNTVAAIMQSDSTVDSLNAQNIGILRVTAIRNPIFLDDRDRNEASPSFDFTLTHKQINIINIDTMTVGFAVYEV
jgi:E217 gateway protein gp29